MVAFWVVLRLLGNCIADTGCHARAMQEISRIRVDGDSFFATVDGEEIQVTTCRKLLWRQHKVFLPPLYGDECVPQTICCNAAEAWSDPMQVAGCIHDPWAAAKMADFARGRLSDGVYEKPNAEVLDEHCRFFPALHRALANSNAADRLRRVVFLLCADAQSRSYSACDQHVGAFQFGH